MWQRGNPGNIGYMFQGIRELRAAKGRTALIIVTVMMITVMVTFLSSLASGLSFQSASALKDRLSSGQVLLVEESGSTALASSHLSDAQLSAATSAGGEALFMARERFGSDNVIALSDGSIAAGHVAVPAKYSDAARSAIAQRNAGGGSQPMGAGGRVSEVDVVDKEVYLDHMPIVWMNPADLEHNPAAASAAIMPKGFTLDSLNGQQRAALSNTAVLEGNTRWEASSSYKGEQGSLSMMINLLYVISALVLGAFFTVWTMQRLRGIAISSALGAARRVLVADSLGQAVIVLALGVLVGIGITFGFGQLLPESMPIVLDSSTLAQPSLILAVAGLLGAAISLRPVLKVEPRSAMANA